MTAPERELDQGNEEIERKCAGKGDDEIDTLHQWAMSLTPMKCVSGDALPEDMERIQLEVLIAQEESRGLGNRLRIGSRSKLRAGAEPVCRRWSALLAFLRSLSLFFFFLDYSVSIVPFLDSLCFGFAPGIFFSFFSSLFSFSSPYIKAIKNLEQKKSLR